MEVVGGCGGGVCSTGAIVGMKWVLWAKRDGRWRLLEWVDLVGRLRSR